MVDLKNTIMPDDQINGPTISNAEFFIESLFGSKSRLEVRALRISPSRRGFLVEIDIRRKVKKSAKKAG